MNNFNKHNREDIKMRKKLSLTVAIIMSLLLLAGCAGGNTVDENQPEEADVVTTASIVDVEADFSKAISSDGKWIIATLNDLTFEKELVVEGTFYDGGDSKNDVYRKIAPYAQDDDYNVTERYTITATQMTIISPNTKFQAGTFAGDIFVEANGFILEDAVVEGNLYFAREEFQQSAEITENSEVSGEIEVVN
jgi:hypothetical protein